MIGRVSTIMSHLITTNRLFCQKISLSKSFKGVPLPEIPKEGSCCGNGCQNCVWLIYAEEVLDVFENHPDFKDKSNRKYVYCTIESLLKNEINDPNLREFILMDIKSKFS